MLGPSSFSRSALALQIIEGDADGVAALDPEFRFTFANPAAERMLGLSERELVGRSQWEAFPATVGTPLETAYRRAMEERVAISMGSQDGPSHRWHDVKVTPSEDGGLIVRFRDITEHRRAAEAVRAEKQRFNAVLDQLPAYPVLLSPDYHVLFANRFFHERFGESHGRRCYEYLFQRTEPCEACQTYSVLKTNAPHRWEWTGPDGRSYDIHDFPFTDTDGSTLIMEVGLDISERKRAEAELAKYREHLEEVVKDRTCQLETANARLQSEVADRKQAEKALRRSEEHFRAMAEALPQIVWTAGAEGSIEWFNQRWYDYTGEPQGASEGWSWDRVAYPDDLAHTLKNWQEARQRDAFFQNEIRLRRHDGQYRWFLVRAWPMHDAEGSVVRWFGTNTDVHDMKAAEDILREAQSELETRVRERTAELQETNQRLREEIQERMRTEQSLRLEEARLDALLRLSQISEAPLEEIANFTLEQAIALTHSKIGFVGFLNDDETVYTLNAVSKDVVKECNATGDPMLWRVVDAGIWADAIRERRTLFVNDYSIPHPRKKGLPPGHPYVERFMVVPIFDGQRIAALAGVGNKTSDYDKSDERQIVLLLSGMWSCAQKSRSKEELQKAYDELEGKVAQRTAELARVAGQLEVRNREVELANRMKSEFLRRVSHEMRTPMNAIVGFSDLLAEEGEGPLGDTYRRFVRNVREGARHLMALISDLLDLSKIEAGRIDLDREWFACDEAVEEVLSVIAPLAKVKNIALDNRLVRAVRVNADRTRFKQILYNLLSNAVKFTQENGRVWIEECSRGDAARFSVGDNGIGIPDEELEAVFEEFHQVSAPSVTGKEGTGLGLAITRRLVELHGGTVEVESRLGHGSRFFFSLGQASVEPAGAAGHGG